MAARRSTAPWLSALLSFLLAWTARSEAASLTLDQAVSLALERSTEVQRLTTQVSLDEAATRQAEAWRRPNLNLSLSDSEQLSRITALDGSVEGQATHGVSLRASSSLSLFDGFSSQAALRSSRLELQSAGQDVAQARQRVALETAADFLAVLSAEGLIGVAQENIAAQQDQLEQLRAGQEQGTRSRAEVLQQMASLASARMGLVSAEQAQALALLRLKDDLRLDLGEELALISPAPGALVGAPSTYDADEVSRQALSGRPEIDGQHLRVQAAEEQVRQARAGLLPDLSLSVSGGTSYSGQDGAPSAADQLFDHNPSTTVGLSLALPLFDRRQTSTAVTRAKLQVRNEQLTLEIMKREVDLAVQQSLLEHRTAARRLETSEAQLAAATEALDAMQARYDTGSATFVELSQARAQYVDAQASRVRSRFDLAAARLAVEYQRGAAAWDLALRQLTAVSTPNQQERQER